MTAHFSYVIVGGGPAGTTAAEALSRAKKNVLLIEKSQYHSYREKPCGGGLGPVTVKLFPYTTSQGIHKTSKLILTLGNNKLEHNVPIIMVNRNQFDRHLIDRAIKCGTKVLFGRIVQSINMNTRTVTLDNKLKITYNYLIGAGGVSCPVKRELDFKVKTVPLIVGKSDGKELNKSDSAEIVFFDGFNGYAWIFPKGKFLDVGIGGDAPLQKIKETFNKFLKERNLELYEHKGWHLPFEVSTTQFFTGPKVLLCGDAGGFVNPATGEGIRYAMQSGLEAAQVLLGTRKLDAYPSFLPMLQRLEISRTRIITQGIALSFEEMKHSPELIKDTVDFFFEDKPLQKRISLSEEEKLKALKSISQTLDK